MKVCFVGGPEDGDVLEAESLTPTVKRVRQKGEWMLTWTHFGASWWCRPNRVVYVYAFKDMADGVYWYGYTGSET